MAAQASAFFSPLARIRQLRASRMVPTPIVIPRRGISSGDGNRGAFWATVVGVSAFARGDGDEASELGEDGGPLAVLGLLAVLDA